MFGDSTRKDSGMPRKGLLSGDHIRAGASSEFPGLLW